MFRTRSELTADLRTLGVVLGDVVMVHASLHAIGDVEGRAASVVEALDEAVGPGGTVMVILGARDDWAWINERAEEDRPALFANAIPFDYLRTPADPDVGVLAEVFRQTPGTVVNDHPEARFGVRGHLAQSLLTDAPWHDYFGPGSPLARLVEAGGKVLRLGADPDTTTLLHYAEYLAPIDSKRRVRRQRLVRSETGVEVRTVDCLDDSEGIVDYPGGDYFAVILADYLATSRASRGFVGAASSELIDAADLVDFAVSWMTDHLASSSPPRWSDERARPD
jgi:aminoglycoside 3-N-acetyltransferase